MQGKVIGTTLGAILYGAAMYYAGIVSEQQKRQSSITNRIQIEQPILQNLNKNEQTYSNFDTFSQNAITPNIRLISYPDFKILYSTYFKCPLAVHQKVTKELADGDFPRRDSFFSEQNIQKQFRITDDFYRKSQAYKHFNFTRGHMAAAGNYSGNKQAKFQTFSLANVVPQNQYNNGGIWNSFQRYSRNLVMSGKCENVQIISGPIYYKNNPYTKDDGSTLQNIYKTQSLVLFQNGVVAPQKLYKIIKCNKDGRSYINGFQFWNKKTFDNDKSLSQFKTSVESIQNQTGLKFNIFPKINVNQQIDLLTYDKDDLLKTKRYYDDIFFNNLMKKSQSLDQLNNSFNRAKQQGIYIVLDNFKEQVENMFSSQIAKIDIQSKGPCEKLSSLMKINKNLFYLYQLNQNNTKIIQEKQRNQISQCLMQVKNGQAQKNYTLKSIRSNISYSFKKQIEINKKLKGTEKPRIFKYINENLLKNFVEQKQFIELQQQNKSHAQTSENS